MASLQPSFSGLQPVAAPAPRIGPNAPTTKTRSSRSAGITSLTALRRVIVFVEIDQEIMCRRGHRLAHLGNVGFRKFITEHATSRPPAATGWNRAWIVQLVEQESVGDVAVGLVLGQHQNVRAVLVDAHRSTSSAGARALTRSPATWTSLNGRALSSGVASPIQRRRLFAGEPADRLRAVRSDDELPSRFKRPAKRITKCPTSRKREVAVGLIPVTELRAKCLDGGKPNRADEKTLFAVREMLERSVEYRFVLLELDRKTGSVRPRGQVLDVLEIGQDVSEVLVNLRIRRGRVPQDPREPVSEVRDRPVGHPGPLSESPLIRLGRGARESASGQASALNRRRGSDSDCSWIIGRATRCQSTRKAASRFPAVLASLTCARYENDRSSQESLSSAIRSSGTRRAIREPVRTRNAASPTLTSISMRSGTSDQSREKSLGLTSWPTRFVPRAILWRISRTNPTVDLPVPFFPIKSERTACRRSAAGSSPGSESCARKSVGSWRHHPCIGNRMLMPVFRYVKAGRRDPRRGWLRSCGGREHSFGVRNSFLLRNAGPASGHSEHSRSCRCGHPGTMTLVPRREGNRARSSLTLRVTIGPR